MHTTIRNPQDSCAKRLAKYCLPPVLSMGAGLGAAWSYFQYGGQAAQRLWNTMPNLPAQETLWNFLLQNVTLSPAPPPPETAQISMQTFVNQLQFEISNGITPLSQIVNRTDTNTTEAGEYIWDFYLQLNQTANTPLWISTEIPGSPPSWNSVLAIGGGVMAFGLFVSFILCWCRSRRKTVGYMPVSNYLPEMPPQEVEMQPVVQVGCCTICKGPLSPIDRAACRKDHQSCAASPNVGGLRYRPLQ